MTYFQRTQEIKKFIAIIDRQWGMNFHNFILQIQDKEGFDESLITLNPNTTLKTMLRKPKLHASLELFSSNVNVTGEIITTLKQIKWNYGMIPADAKISIRFLLDNLDKNFCWRTISQNKYIQRKDVEFFKTIPWDYQGLSANPNFTLYDFVKFHTEGKELDWFEISKHHNVKIDDIQLHYDLPWDEKGISLNPNINYRIVLDNEFIDWDYSLLSKNPRIKMSDVEADFSKPWCWSNLSVNPNITIQFVLYYKKKNWNWLDLSANPSITFKMFRNNRELPWDANGISLNPNITSQIVLSNPKFNWNYQNLCSNTFQKERDNFYKKNLKFYFTVCKIQRFWRERCSNRNFQIGRKVNSQRYNKLLDDYDELYEVADNVKPQEQFNGFMIYNSAYC